jgi:hypothetical protein
MLTMMFIKQSIGWLLLRFVQPKPLRYVIYVVVGSSSMASILFFFGFLFHCRPVQAIWDFTVYEAKCLPPQQLEIAAYVHSGVTILGDWILTLLPIPIVWNLQLKLRAKISLTLTLSIGLL